MKNFSNHPTPPTPPTALQPAAVGEFEPPTGLQPVSNAVALWNTALEALRAEMPRAAYETWVANTQAVSLAEGILTVAAQNAYARDWLNNRILNRSKQLTGADLRFVVVEEDEEETDDSAGDSDESDEDASGGGEVEIEVSAEEYASLYERAVRPERAVYLSGYFRRWLPLLGPDMAWFYVGFRQAAYWSSRGRKAGQYSQYSGKFSGKQVASLCGVTERTFWNRVGRDETWQKLAGLIRKDGPRYTVAMSLPLTGPDAGALAHWLASHIEEYESVEALLNAACQTPVKELLAGTGKSGDMQPATPFQLLHDLFPDMPEKVLRSSAERLRAHLMPQSDQIVVSQFFMENILPWLKAGPAWVYVLLRDKCFVDRDGGGRDTVTVYGGYKEIADLLGVSRARTVYDWLRDPIARIYLAGSVERTGAGWDNPLTVRVLLNDVPPEIVQAASLQKRPVFDANFSVGLLKFDAIFSDSCRDQSSLPQISVFFDANFSPSLTQISVFFDAIFSILKPLTLKTEPLNPGKTDQPLRAHEEKRDSTQSPSVGRSDSESVSDSDSPVSVSQAPQVWEFEKILQRMGVNPSSRKRLREENIPPETFLAWFLEAMTMPKVDPLRVAIAWTLDPRKRAGAAEDFKLLARSPGDMRLLLQEHAGGGRRRYSSALWEEGEREENTCADLQTSQAYKRAFGENQDVAAALLRILFGVGVAENQTG